MEILGCLNGVLAPVARLEVSVLDHGLTVGDGVFETIPVRHGRPFALDRHLDRLEQSARGLGLETPDRTAIAEWTARLVDANPSEHDRIRLTVTDGIGPPGSDRGHDPQTVVIVSTRKGPADDTVDVVISPWSRNPDDALCGLKTTSYGGNVRALAHARERGAGEALFCSTDATIAEGSGSNIFAVVDGILVTPPLSTGCLAGVTRSLVIGLTEAVEQRITEEQLFDAPEAFLTSSTRDVQPIARVDGRTLPGCPGPMTVAAATALAELMKTDPNP